MDIQVYLLTLGLRTVKPAICEMIADLHNQGLTLNECSDTVRTIFALMLAGF